MHAFATPSPRAGTDAGPLPRARLARMTAAALMTVLVIGLYPFVGRTPRSRT